MKIILSLIIIGALAVSGFGQTRNVLVGTNNTVVQPTNFWSADASNARTGLGLGSAATNPATAFQPSSSELTNISSGNGGSLTNIQATNIVGIIGVSQGGTGATNANNARTSLGLGSAATNPSSAFQPSSSSLTNLSLNNGGGLTNIQSTSIVGIIPASNISSVTFTGISGTVSVAQGGTGATNASDARQNLGSTTIGDAVFIATNAESARTALSLGTAATSSTTDFQPANANLTNLSTNDGSLLANIPIAGVVNLQSNLDTKLATNGSASGLSNITAANITGTVALASNITGTAALATNVTGTVAIVNGGTGSTNASAARTALGATTVGNSLFTLVNPSAIRFLRLNADNTATALSASDFRIALSLDTAATNPSSAFQPSSTNLTTLSVNDGSGLTNLVLSNVVGLQSALDGKLATNGNAINLTNFPALLLRTNGNGASLTNLTAANITGTVALASNLSSVLSITNGGTGATNLTNARINIFPSYSGNSNKVLAVNSNGTDIEWVVQSGGGAITSGVVAITNGGTGATNAATARTNLGLGALWLTNSNVTNFRTDIGLGATNDVVFSVVRGGSQTNHQVHLDNAEFYGAWTFLSEVDFDAPAATRTNLGIALAALTNTNNANFIQAVLPSYTGNQSKVLALNSSANGLEWVAGGSGLAVPISIVNGGTGATNAATARTNIGLGAAWLTNTVLTNFRNDIGLGSANAVTFGSGDILGSLSVTGAVTFGSAPQTRTNLGLGATWLTNTNVTNFRTAIGLGWPALTNTNAATQLLGVSSGGSVLYSSTNQLTFTNPVRLLAGNTANGVVGTSVDLASALYDTANDEPALQITDGNVALQDGDVPASFRGELGLPLAALTNTSNVTMMRALGGSTNTNEPYSGSVSLTNTNTLVFSNGVLLRIQ